MYDAKDMLEWYRDDAGSEKRIKFWLEPANRARNQFNNLVVRSDNPNEWIINATTVKRAIEAIKGMVIQQVVVPVAKGSNEDSVMLEKMVVSWLAWRYKQLRRRGWYVSRLENVLIEGVGCVSVEYDPYRWDKLHPNGNIVIQYHNPRNVFLDSRAETTDEIARETIIHRMTLQEANQMFPDFDFLGNSSEMIEGRDYPSSSPQRSSANRYYPGSQTNQEFVEVAQSLFKEVVLVPHYQDITTGEWLELPEGFSANGLPTRKQRVEKWHGCYYYGSQLLGTEANPSGEPLPTLTGRNPLKLTVAHHVEGSPYGNGQAQPVLDTNVAISALYSIMMQRVMKTQGYIDIVNSLYVKDKDRLDEIAQALLGNNPVETIIQEFADQQGNGVNLDFVHKRLRAEPVTQQELALIQALAEEAQASLAVQNAQVGIFNASDPASKSALAQQSANTQLQDILDAIQDGDTEILKEIYEIDKRTVTYETVIPALNSVEREFVMMNLVIPTEAAQLRPYSENESIWEMSDNPGFSVINPLWAGDLEISASVNYNTPQQQEQRIAHAELMIQKGFLSPEDYAAAFPEYEDNPRYYLERAKAQQIQAQAELAAMQPPVDAEAANPKERARSARPN